MKITIVVRKFRSFDLEDSPPPQVGKKGIFSNDLVLLRYNNKTPGNGLPRRRRKRLAGTHSGFVTIFRIPAPDDDFFPPGSYLFGYEGTYKFNTLPNTPLKKGQITARGVLLLDGNFTPLELITFAITGGTEAYRNARGQITEPNEDDRLLDIEI
jgi:hypothetical protein